jgi:hypothetical protein
MDRSWMRLNIDLECADQIVAEHPGVFEAVKRFNRPAPGACSLVRDIQPTFQSCPS